MSRTSSHFCRVDSRQNTGATGAKKRNLALVRVSGALPTGAKQGQDRGKSGAKLYVSEIYHSFTLCIPLCNPSRPPPGLLFGLVRTLPETGASGLPLEPLPGGGVDNFRCLAERQTAQKIGAVDKVCKLLKSLMIPENVPNVIHIAYFIQRASC